VGLVRWDDGTSSADCVDLPDVVRQHRIRLVAFDLRDTLVRSPRQGKVARALRQVGVPEFLATHADSAASLALQNKFAGLPGVVDWKLVEFYEAVLALAQQGLVLAPLDFERAFTFICDEYREKTVALVPETVLVTICSLLATEGCGTAVVTDGPSAREAEVLGTIFPAFAARLSLFTSGLAGVNKFQPEYYERLAANFGIPPSRILVVGNRIDKDVTPARIAGCETCLIKCVPPEGYSGYWAPDISSVLSSPPSA
jgi:FMN phosphatase YigB (HAD superfamily)